MGGDVSEVKRSKPCQENPWPRALSDPAAHMLRQAVRTTNAPRIAEQSGQKPPP